jgi:methionyl-tRNA formyltransferase
MRFAFAGIDFLGGVFDALVEAGWEPLRLFTRPCDGIYDFNDVIVAKARKLRLPIQLSPPTAADFRTLADQRCDALVVAGYPWLVRGWQDRVTYGLNFHPSPLPVGRGPYPLFRAILEGFESWGVSAHGLTETFDTGPILAQETFDVSAGETHDSLLAKCQMACSRLAGDIAFDLPSVWSGASPQQGGSYWPRITDAERTIDWSGTVENVMRMIRAFGSIECIARMTDGPIYVSAANGWTEAHDHQPGALVHGHRRHLVFAVRDGFVQLTGWSRVSLANARDIGR